MKARRRKRQARRRRRETGAEVRRGRRVAARRRSLAPDRRRRGRSPRWRVARTARPRPPRQRPRTGGGIPAAPSVRRYARELGVDRRQVPGTGPGGRIGQDDVTAYVKQALTGGVRAAPPRHARAAGLLEVGRGRASSRCRTSAARRPSTCRRLAGAARHAARQGRRDRRSRSSASLRRRASKRPAASSPSPPSSSRSSRWRIDTLSAVRFVGGHGERARSSTRSTATSAWRSTRRTACSCR